MAIPNAMAVLKELVRWDSRPREASGVYVFKSLSEILTMARAVLLEEARNNKAAEEADKPQPGFKPDPAEPARTNYSGSQTIPFNPIGMAEIKSIEVERGGEAYTVTLSVTLEPEQAKQAFRRFIVNDESLAVSLERGV
jgi:hypothetical protein